MSRKSPRQAKRNESRVNNIRELVNIMEGQGKGKGIHMGLRLCMVCLMLGVAVAGRPMIMKQEVPLEQEPIPVPIPYLEQEPIPVPIPNLEQEPIHVPIPIPIPIPNAMPMAPEPQPQPEPPQKIITFIMHHVVGGPNPSVKPFIFSSNLNPNLNLNPNGLAHLTNPNMAMIPFFNNFGNNGHPGAGNINGGFINSKNGIVAGLGGITNAVKLPTTVAGLPSLKTPQEEAGLDHPQVMMMEDPLSEGPEEGSALIGKAEGYYVEYAENPHIMLMAFTATFTESEFHLDDVGLAGAQEEVEDDNVAPEGSSIQLAGQYNAGEPEKSEFSVAAGTGVFHNAQGHAVIDQLPSPPHSYEHVLKFTITLAL